ncbi:MAG: hypothetical protein ACPGR2_12700 [Psychrobium sp.]
MSKKDSYSFINTKDYSNYLDAMKLIVKQNEADKQKLSNLKNRALIDESKLQSYVQNLKHIQEMQLREYERWQERAGLLAKQQEELELLIENQSQNLAFSKAQLEHGLRMIDLMPKSKVEDYLASANLNKSISESIRGDWVKVGAQIANSFYKYKEIEE